MSEEKRYTPSVSLKESQRDWIKEQAEKHGISYTHYMRKVVLGELPQAKEPFHQKDHLVPLEDGVSYGDLRRLFSLKMPKATNNLNQIARKLNSGDPVDDKMLEAVEDIRDDISRMGIKIFEMIE